MPSSRVSTMRRHLTRLGTVAALQLVAVVLAHELTYLARYGSMYNEALVHAGHGTSWSGAAVTTLVLGAGLLVLGVARLARLGLLVRRTPEGAAPSPRRALDSRSLLAAWLRVGPRIAVLTAVLLTVQENVERISIGAVAPGIGILVSPEYAGGLWVALAVGLVVGLVAALFAWRRDVLLGRLRAARVALPRGSRRSLRRTGIQLLPPIESVLGRIGGLRAPPRSIAAPPAG